MVRLLFGGKTPQTVMSIKEISDKMPEVITHIRVLVAKHASITDPLSRADVEMQILEKFLELEDFASKFKKSFLDSVERNSRYIFKLLSNMDIRSLILRWPNPKGALVNYLNATKKTINIFQKEEFENMRKSYGLRGYANEIIKRVSSNLDSTAKAISQKILSAKQMQQQGRMQQQRAISVKGNIPKRQQLKPRFAQ